VADNTHQIAQYNFARARADLDDPLMAGFVGDLQRINELSDRSEGFVWRLKTEKGDATDIRPYADSLVLVTLSVWESLDTLRDFVYLGEHADRLRRRKEWFEEPAGDYLVLWWVPSGHIPDVDEGKRRLEYMEAHGPSPLAFTFAKTFDPPAYSGVSSAFLTGEGSGGAGK
jgi:hypothetical protein